MEEKTCTLRKCKHCGSEVLNPCQSAATSQFCENYTGSSASADMSSDQIGTGAEIGTELCSL